MDRMRYLDLFLAESREHLGAVYEALSALEVEPPGAGEERVHELLRHCHSLKGMASTMGFTSMVRLAHVMEEVFLRFPDAAPGSRAVLIPQLHEALVCLGGVIDAVERGESARSRGAEQLARELETLAGPAPAAAARVATADAAWAGIGDAETVANAPQPARASSGRWSIDLLLAQAESMPAGRTVSVLRRLGRLGRVEHVNPPMPSGEPPRFRGRLQLVLSYPGSRDALAAALQAIPGIAEFRLREEARTKPTGAREARPVRWARVRAELLDVVLEHVLDLILEQDRALAAAADPASRARHLARSSSLLKQLYGTVRELRLVPFGSVAYRLNQCVLRLARDLDRQIQFRIEGTHIRLDRSLLDELLGPLEHMVRNALDHGLESPKERVAAEKPLSGSLVLSLDRQRDNLVVALQDDGRGLSPDALRRAAVERGWLDDRGARALSDADALMLITRPGFSTAMKVTETSGRGVGMDAVRRAIEQLGGRLRITSERGRGTRFEITLPLHLALIQALLVRSAGELFALPVSVVQRTLGPAAAAGLRAPGTPHGELPLHRMNERLGLERDSPSPTSSVLVLDLPRGPLGLVVDDVLGQREIVVKPLRAPLSGLTYYSGAALLEDGSIALVVDPYRLDSGERPPGASSAS